jgi:hypothetical protein
MRSKRNVVLAILGGMLALFVLGVLVHTFRPTAVQRTVRDLPTYPGATEKDTAPSAGSWSDFAARGNPEGEVRVMVYGIPRGTSQAAVLAYYGEHVPRSWRRVLPGCYAHGDVRVRVLPLESGELDVAVADGGQC